MLIIIIKLEMGPKKTLKMLNVFVIYKRLCFYVTVAFHLFTLSPILKTQEKKVGCLAYSSLPCRLSLCPVSIWLSIYTF